MAHYTATHRPPIHASKPAHAHEPRIPAELKNARPKQSQKPRIFTEEKKAKQAVQASSYHSLRDHERGVYFASPRIKITPDQQSPKPEPHIYSLNLPRSYDRKTS